MRTARLVRVWAPRARIRRVATAAPPPRRADPRANNWEMLVKEPTISSGEGIANADPVPTRQMATPTTRRTEADRRPTMPAFAAVLTTCIYPTPELPTQTPPPHH